MRTQRKRIERGIERRRDGQRELGNRPEIPPGKHRNETRQNTAMAMTDRTPRPSHEWWRRADSCAVDIQLHGLDDDDCVVNDDAIASTTRTCWSWFGKIRDGKGAIAPRIETGT